MKGSLAGSTVQKLEMMQGSLARIVDRKMEVGAWQLEVERESSRDCQLTAGIVG
jgi:hypothetical protein